MKTANNYLFDVDGTLTPSRGIIDPLFKEWFLGFCHRNNVILVTGSDRPKTIEQVGQDVYDACKRVYNCSGNDVYQGSDQVKFNKWTLPEDAHEWLSIKLTESTFPLRTGLHFEHRTGMCNFSVVGRNANQEQRALYVEYDISTEERIKIAQTFDKRYPDLKAKVGGETGLDIFPAGCDKGQVADDYDIETIRFFGDRCDPQGNDYPLAVLLQSHQVYSVTGWKHCWELLKNV